MTGELGAERDCPRVVSSVAMPRKLWDLLFTTGRAARKDGGRVIGLRLVGVARVVLALLPSVKVGEGVNARKCASVDDVGEFEDRDCEVGVEGMGMTGGGAGCVLMVGFGVVGVGGVGVWQTNSVVGLLPLSGAGCS